MQPPAPVRLIVGLGNPGPRFTGTRHNIGFSILDSLLRESGGTWETFSHARSLQARWGLVRLLKPQTFMNLSGEAVALAASFFKISPDQVLVVLDDWALPLGRLRIRKSGSDGGHNGMASILRHLGTNAVPRLRFGIGTPEGDPSDFVLRSFSEPELDTVRDATRRAVEAIEFLGDKGLDSAMNFYNATDPN